ncbi:MAG: hypothetical protein CSA58_02890 [Micrococcales bacterium]|nr:MAG: hypothetical protein CSA58_02890 [Micrococcales bacterium]
MLADPRYEFRRLSVPAGLSLAETARLLTEHAEYGRWELARTRVYLGGRRRFWLRRRVVRVRRTL